MLLTMIFRLFFRREKCNFASYSTVEGSHNGIAAVLKTAGRKPVGVRVPRLPLFLTSTIIFHTPVAKGAEE